MQAFDKAVELDPDDSNAWDGKALGLCNLERFEEALQASEKALELSPNNCGGLHLKGVALDNLGRHEEALQAYDKVLELYPDNEAWIDKLDVLRKLGRDEEAQRLEEEV